MTEREVKQVVEKLRAGSTDYAETYLWVVIRGTVQGALDEVADLVVGRLVNKGVCADDAREAFDVISTYRARFKDS